MEAAAQRKKFVCKFCHKRYPCGKSLGGHIRIHLNGNNGNGGNSGDLDQEAKLQSNNGWGQNKRESSSDPEAAAAGGYVLRENPRKTKRFVLDSNNTKLLQEKVCKECGKGFQSLKALCGHMACHSKNSFEDYSGGGGGATSDKHNKDSIFDGQSDTETSAPSKGRRSKRIMRYKTIGAYSSSLSMVNGCSLSSVVSDEEQEQEDVAVSLMMLSRDSSFKGCFSLVADSSDNNSVILEAKSSNTKMRIHVKNNGSNFVFNGNELKKSNSKAIVNENSDNSDSGYFMNEPKKADSDISDHGYHHHHHPKLKFGSRIDDDDIDSKKSKAESCSSSAQKRGKFFSLTTHRRTNGLNDSIYESAENSLDNDYTPPPPPPPPPLSSKKQLVQSRTRKNPNHHQQQQNPSGNNAGKKLVSNKKRKLHECPFCSKVFQSGQALGGHKRSHFVGVGEDRTLVINQQLPEMPIPALIDLNLPAPVEEEAMVW